MVGCLPPHSGLGAAVPHSHAAPMEKEGGRGQDLLPALSGSQLGLLLFPLYPHGLFPSLFTIWREVEVEQCPRVLPSRLRCVLTQRSSGNDLMSCYPCTVSLGLDEELATIL